MCHNKSIVEGHRKASQIGENLDACGVGDPGEKVQFLVWCSGLGLRWYACVSVWAALQLWSFCGTQLLSHFIFLFCAKSEKFAHWIDSPMSTNTVLERRLEKEKFNCQTWISVVRGQYGQSWGHNKLHYYFILHLPPKTRIKNSFVSFLRYFCIKNYI